MKSEHVRNIALDIILSLITGMLYNIYWQYRQMKALNDMLKEDKYSFLAWFFFSLLTLGLYHIYHEYRKSADIAFILKKENSYDGLISVALVIFGFMLIADAIQQSEINRFYGSNRL